MYQPYEKGFNFSYYFFMGHHKRYRPKSDLPEFSGEYLMPDMFCLETYIFGERPPANYGMNVETLISIQSKIKEPLLSHLDLVGLTIDEVDEKLGKPLWKGESEMIYGHDNRTVMIVHHEKAEGLKYLKIKKAFDPADEKMIKALRLRDK